MYTLSRPMLSHNQNGMTFILYTDGTYVWNNLDIPKIKYDVFTDIVSQAESKKEVLECVKEYLSNSTT